MFNEIKTGFIGLGSVGQLCAKIATERPELKIVAAADFNPEIAGRDLGDILDEKVEDVKVSESLDEMLSTADVEVAVLCTCSHLEKVADQIKRCSILV